MRYDPGRFDADDRGWFGDFGGRFMPEALMAALDELDAAYREAWADPEFRAAFDQILREYAGAPSRLYEAQRLSEKIQTVTTVPPRIYDFSVNPRVLDQLRHVNAPGFVTGLKADGTVRILAPSIFVRMHGSIMPSATVPNVGYGIGSGLGAEYLIYGRIEKSTEKGKDGYKAVIKILNVKDRKVEETSETFVSTSQLAM